ncbi:hypothetical protein [Aquamicrobium sp.]|jgi:hypothetical protein|uniref:hypothetical protein n=1 Tax=Aquamicrobium sp. TaxID=1872579 RepID=UPI00258BD9FE|nr:hypothetical protein [Aquamicrobium sp.]MCK9553202.1 hypothetical protein [Aquamicrobium sp.]
MGNKIISLLQKFVMENIFSDRPCNENGWEVFMSNEDLEIPEGFELSQAYELENAREIRGLMQSQFDDLCRLQDKISLKEVWILSQYDLWFSSGSETILGMFDSYDKAYGKMMEKFSNDDLQQNGENQWLSDEQEFGLMIYSSALNQFEGEDNA